MANLNNSNEHFGNCQAGGAKTKCPLEKKQEESKKEETKKVKIRVSIFFDGTGNNKDNTDIRRLYEKNIELESKIADLEFDSLNLNSISNSSGPNIGSNNFSPNEIDYLLRIRQLEGQKKDLEQVKKRFITSEDGKENLDRKEGFKTYAENRTKWKKQVFDESYMNAYTNVGFLWRELDVENTQYESQIKIYVEGIGTRTGTGDYGFGTGLGIGESGVMARAEKAKYAVINSIKNEFKKMKDLFDDKEFNVELDEVTLDLFGFSRGAAAARYFCFIAKNDQKIVTRIRDMDTHRTEEKIETIKNIKNSLLEWKVNVNSDIKISFIGLFDTVSSFGLTKMLNRARADFEADLTNKNQHDVDKKKEVDNVSELKLNEPSMAEKVVHLCAIDEYRYNFALTTIEGFGDQSNEYYLPGVHSDVGGSYEDNCSEDKVVRELENTELKQAYGRLAAMAGSGISPPQAYFDSINIIKQKFQNDILKNIAQWFVDKGWVEKNEVYPAFLEMNEVITFPLISQKSSLVRDGLYFLSSPDQSYYEVYLKRHNIRNLYSRIPLHFMKDKAIEAGLSFNKRIETFGDCGKNAIPEELKFLESEIGKSKRIDYFNDKNLLKVRRGHLHFNISRDSMEDAYSVVGQFMIPYAGRFKKGAYERMRFPDKSS